MAEKNASEFRLNLGGACLALHCQQEGMCHYLSQWFDRPSDSAAAQINLKFELLPHEESLDLPNTLLKTKQIGPDGSFDIAHGLIKGHFNRTTGWGLIQAKGALTRGVLMRVMEQIFYQAFQSTLQFSGLRAALVHSSAVIAGGSGFLFVGPSEAGKSTAALNSMAHHVLGDEMTLVLPGPDRTLIEGTPFNGNFKAKRPGQAPLRAIFLLKQAPQHRILPIDLAEAASLLAAEIVPPVGLDQIPGPQTLPWMVEFAAELVERVPIFRLELLPDPGFWNVIDQHFHLGLATGNK